MKKNNKGISLVSLIIVIIAMIILISVVITMGYDYIQESNRAKVTAVVKLISDAAMQRQSDAQIEADTTYYVGHLFKPNSLDKIKGIPEDFTIDSEDLWYLIDADSALQLGIIESDRYIEKDLKNPTAEIVKAVLVDYVTGEAYLVEIDRTLLSGSIEDSICNEAIGGMHLYSIRTCTKGSFCINCGKPNGDNAEPAGHEYADPTCTAAATCIKCKDIDLNRPATGHDFEKDALGAEKWITDATRHWKACRICGTKKDTETHTKGSVRIEIDDANYDPQYHKEVCSICGWESVKIEHKIKYEITSDNTHRRYCEECEYSVEHRDSGWITIDNQYHWRECYENCPLPDGSHIDCIPGNKLFNDKHEDKNGDNICDVCNKVLDNVPPSGFTSEGSYARFEKATTTEITVSAYTKDNVGIKGYKFAIDENGDGEIDWDSIPIIETEDLPAEKTFTNLKADTPYDIYVIAIDIGNNQTEQYKIPNTRTAKMPKIEIVGIPNKYVSDEFTLSFKPEVGTPSEIAENIKTEYSLDGGVTWTESDTVTIDKEDVNVWVRGKDKCTPEPNKGEITKVVISNFDNTAPTVNIATKTGDDANTVKTSHTAVVTITDNKAQIAPETTIRYAWSLSNTVAPTEYIEVKTTNTENKNSTSVEITTPANVAGNYYLWIDKGVEDSLGNKTTKEVCSGDYYNVDDKEPTITNITMYNPNPGVEGQSGFVKQNGTVRVTFVAEKVLAEAPTVKIAGITSANVTSNDNLIWTASLVIPDSVEEGPLSLNISGIKALSGKVATKEYTEADLTGSQVIYDKTLPDIEYIEK